MKHGVGFLDIVLLHSKITASSPSKIQKLLNKFNANMLKELLLIYLKFFLQSSNRTKYFDENYSNSLINTSILNLSIKKFKKKTVIKHVSIFNKLPELLFSECISFLHQKDRAKLCRINLLFFKSSNQSIAKYHLKITNKFIKISTKI
eukprot:550270_1